ncbi:unnamed protein product [Larinioides sclopetarius]|uniref:Ribosomal protein L33 n=1 Tax=Larinioides sclopetarius TaxID=280406 RepID=A0AAV2ATE8_9ARAC
MAEREHELSLPTLYFVSLVVSEDKWRKSREAKVAVMSSRSRKVKWRYISLFISHSTRIL